MTPGHPLSRRASVRGATALLALAGLGLCTLATGQSNQPDRPVRLVVGFAHDGSDISARIISQKLTQIWDQQVIVENRPGAAVNIGADAVVNDEVQLSFGAQSAFDAFIQADRLRPLAVTKATRQSLLPEVPTIKEASGIDFSAEVWYGLLGPAKMPAALVNKISEDLRKVVADPDTQARLREAGVQSAFLNAAEMGELMKSNVATWRAVINRVQISLD